MRCVLQLTMAITAMVAGTNWSYACCEIIAKEGGAEALLKLARNLNKSK